MKSAPLRKKREKVVIGAKNEPMTQANFEQLIPPPNYGLNGRGRWTSTRKANAGLAIKAGFLSMEDALRRWPGTTHDEIKNEWIDGYTSHGLTGVKVTKIQKIEGSVHYRSASKSE